MSALHLKPQDCLAWPIRAVHHHAHIFRKKVRGHDCCLAGWDVQHLLVVDKDLTVRAVLQIGDHSNRASVVNENRYPVGRRGAHKAGIYGLLACCIAAPKLIVSIDDAAASHCMRAVVAITGQVAFTSA